MRTRFTLRHAASILAASARGSSRRTSTCRARSAASRDSGDDGAVSFTDIVVVLANRGSGGPAGDADRSGSVDLQDLLLVLAGWT